MLSVSKLSTVAAGKEIVSTPLGNKFGKPGQLKTDLKDGLGIGVGIGLGVGASNGVSATSAAAAAANDRVQVSVINLFLFFVADNPVANVIKLFTAVSYDFS